MICKIFLAMCVLLGTQRGRHSIKIEKSKFAKIEICKNENRQNEKIQIRKSQHSKILQSDPQT
jgi:hypothetical protein